MHGLIHDQPPLALLLNHEHLVQSLLAVLHRADRASPLHHSVRAALALLRQGLASDSGSTKLQGTCSQPAPQELELKAAAALASIQSAADHASCLAGLMQAAQLTNSREGAHALSRADYTGQPYCYCHICMCMLLHEWKHVMRVPSAMQGLVRGCSAHRP